MNSTPLLELLSHTAMKGAAVLFVALLLGLLLRKTAAARRYALWITAIAALAVLPLAMSILPAWRVLPQTSAELDWPVVEPERVRESVAPVSLSVGTRISFPGSAFEAPAQADPRPSIFWKVSWQEIASWLPVLWLVVAGLLLLRLGWSAWRLRRLEATLPAGECAMLPQTARELGLKRQPRLLIGPRDAVPMVWGVVRPRLLLPEGFTAWPAEKTRGILLHELAHLRRGDPLALWLAQWVKALHWFNPLAWLTLRQLRADQERACDDTVLRQGVRPSDYAQHLLDLSRSARVAPGLALCALTITRCAPVESRVRAILDPKRRREALSLRWLAGLAGCALLIMLPVAMLHAIEGPKLRGRILDRNGVVLAESTHEKMRNYPLKTLVAHVTGYTRRPDAEETAQFGGAAIEKQQNETLKAGGDVALTLDARIQAVAARAMQEGGIERGAAVVLDPRTGEILALVSLPSYDPNVFIPSISFADWDRLVHNRDVPLLQRSLRGFSPGSCFKPLIGLAGIASGVGDQKFTCDGSVKYGSANKECWINRQSGGRHGELGLTEALKVSCSCFWYQFGNAAGVNEIETMSQKIGFGMRYGIADDEDAGILPSPAWMKANRPGEKWSDGHTAAVSVGQGMVLTTPLQLAVLAAAMGNGGEVPQPSLLIQAGATEWRADLTAEGMPASQIESLREGMRLVVNGADGIGKAAKSDKVAIAGKTGTAQNWRRDENGQLQDDNNAWFIGFAPYDKPTLAFAILKQGGKSGGGDCGPIAKRIVEEALALPADGSGEVKPLEEAAEAAPAKVDLEAAEISRQIKLHVEEAGFHMKEFKMGHGRLTILGEAADMAEALNFLGRLSEIGKKWEIVWEFPAPQIMKDGRRVAVRAVGIYQTALMKEAAKKTAAAVLSSQARLRQQSDAAIRMQPAMAKQWAALKQVGLLAHLPAETKAIDLGGSDERRVKSVLEFHFVVPREAARNWLLGSLYMSKVTDNASLDWPEPPEAFQRSYVAANHCMISIHSSDGKTMHVTVLWRKPPILIAPDESTEPRPAGKLAPDYQRDGLAWVDRPAPELAMTLRNLRPAISPEDELRTPTYVEAAQLQLRVFEPELVLPPPPHLQHLTEGLGEESASALLRSAGLSGRMQQALLVRSSPEQR